jgi:hypothetical protein
MTSARVLGAGEPLMLEISQPGATPLPCNGERGYSDSTMTPAPDKCGFRLASSGPAVTATSTTPGGSSAGIGKDTGPPAATSPQEMPPPGEGEGLAGVRATARLVGGLAEAASLPSTAAAGSGSPLTLPLVLKEAPTPGDEETAEGLIAADEDACEGSTDGARDATTVAAGVAAEGAGASVGAASAS